MEGLLQVCGCQVRQQTLSSERYDHLSGKLKQCDAGNDQYHPFYFRTSRQIYPVENGPEAFRRVERFVSCRYLSLPSAPLFPATVTTREPISSSNLLPFVTTEGRTGVPFVDANMRELAMTGFMSNRGRQNVASFLTKDLGLDWRLGAEWFESLLVSSSRWFSSLSGRPGLETDGGVY